MQIEVHIPGQAVRRFDVSRFFIIEGCLTWKERVMERELRAQEIVQTVLNVFVDAYPGVVFYKVFQSKMNDQIILNP
jgi:hypothetical protein